jgi:hypothetical protein
LDGLTLSFFDEQTLMRRRSPGHGILRALYTAIQDFFEPFNANRVGNGLSASIRVGGASASGDEHADDLRLLILSLGTAAPPATGVLNRQVKRRGSAPVRATRIRAVRE